MKPASNSQVARSVVNTPLGRIRVEATARGVCHMGFTKAGAGRPAKREAHASREARAHVVAGIRQLREYFAGQRKEFRLPLDLRGTEYQLRVWQKLLEIPFGQTVSYGELARRVGLPHSPRAAGTACGSNPLAVVVPCHRVIGADGKLHGYGGGLWRKQRLLELEGSAPRSFAAQKALPLNFAAQPAKLAARAAAPRA
jgi:methylated-DNA-[protein]-cysteine S-methyltransferase